jgi:hypothetical protein
MKLPLKVLIREFHKRFVPVKPNHGINSLRSALQARHFIRGLA